MSDDRETIPTSRPQADSSLRPGFTFEELEAELRLELDAVLGFDKVVEDDKRIFTLPQLAEMYHCGRTAAQARALDAVDRGDMERVKIQRRDANGTPRIYIAYKLLKK